MQTRPGVVVLSSPLRVRATPARYNNPVTDRAAFKSPRDIAKHNTAQQQNDPVKPRIPIPITTKTPNSFRITRKKVDTATTLEKHPQN